MPLTYSTGTRNCRCLPSPTWSCRSGMYSRRGWRRSAKPHTLMEIVDESRVFTRISGFFAPLPPFLQICKKPLAFLIPYTLYFFHAQVPARFHEKSQAPLEDAGGGHPPCYHPDLHRRRGDRLHLLSPGLS